MSADAYAEDSIVEQPAIQLLIEICWQTLSVLEEVCGIDGTLGRETNGETVLIPRLCTALLRVLSLGITPILFAN